MKLSNRSLICQSMFGAVLLATGVVQAQNQAPAAQQAPYHVAPTPYQNSGPIGCVGCPANGAARRAPVQAGGQAPAAPGGAAAPQRVGPPQNLANPLPYDLLLQNGHVIDAKNNIDKVTDVAIKDGKIAAVGDHLNAKDAAKAIDVNGYIVTPGLVDIHMHVYPATAEWLGRSSDEPAQSGEIPITPRMSWHTLWPDGFTFRSGVTTVVSAGDSGWRNFEDFKEHVIDRSQTRVLAMLNIVGAGMRGGRYEDNLADMNGEATGYMAQRYPGIIVGIKSAHYTGPEWTPYIESVKAGNMANIPVMIDYGSNRIERPLYQLLTKYLRPGDIYTHMYSGLRGEQDPHTLKPQAGLIEGRQRGVWFDAGTGNGSFRFRVTVPLLKEGFLPDSLSTDLHIESMNSSTKDMLNVMSKFMAMGLTLQEVVEESTWHPAREIKQEQLGHLSIGAIADVAVLSEQHGNYGFLDMDNLKMMGDTRLVCQLTVHNGRIVYDLNGISMDLWNQPASSDPQTAATWTVYTPRPALPEQLTPTQK